MPQLGQPTEVETSALNEWPQEHEYSARSSGPPLRLARARSCSTLTRGWSGRVMGGVER